MTGIEQKALALVNKVLDELKAKRQTKIMRKNFYTEEALCRAIEQHEAFRQEVSDAIVFALKVYGGHRTALDPLRRFIITKPDPLVEALEATGDDEAVERAWRLRNFMANSGYEWRKIEGEG